MVTDATSLPPFDERMPDAILRRLETLRAAREVTFAQLTRT